MSGKETESLIEITQLFNVNKVFILVSAIVVLVVIVKTLQRLSTSLQDRLPSQRLLILQIGTVVAFFLYIVGGGLLFYGILNPSPQLLIAVGGSAAVAIGFALKDLVGSIVAGLVLLFDRPFQVGDRVAFGDVYGEIQTIGLRAVRLQTLDDNLVTIPNAKFLTDVVSSGNSGALHMMITANFHIALDSDVEKARSLLYDIVVTSRFAFLKHPVKIVLSEVEIANRLALRLQAKAYVFDVKYEKDFQTDIVSRTAVIFAAHGIKRPQFAITNSTESNLHQA